jgi:peptidoglycan/xylan/chitin deacetylase (PgdA/CDA1 family)
MAPKAFVAMVIKVLMVLLLLGGCLAGAAQAESCGTDALGVSRTISIGGAPNVGLKTYPQTLDLKDHEVVLTFDDGPSAATPRVLTALEAECVKATFFLVGRNAKDRPDLVKREVADGDTVGHHSNTHPSRTMRGMSFAAALKEIDDGMTSVNAAAGGGKTSSFFRFPYFADTPELLATLAKRNAPVFGADLWASDWNEMTPEKELKVVMSRLRRSGGGILLLHDPRRQTADMIPALLEALKAEHFRIVHMVPGEKLPDIRPASKGWSSETDATLKRMGVEGPAMWATEPVKTEPASRMGAVPAQVQRNDPAPAAPEAPAKP